MDKCAPALVFLLLFNAVFAFSQAEINIDGTIEWDTMEINATVSLNMASAGLKLPSGRVQSEALISSEYTRLIRPGILNVPVDSSSVIGDIVSRGEWSTLDVDNLALQGRTVPPALSPDFSSLMASYTLKIDDFRKALIRHERPAEIPITLTPVSVPAYTGIIIIAAESLPVHGARSAALLRPCLFPKIWDAEMNLIFERNMLNPRADTMIRYFPVKDIFSGGPSGLSPEVSAVTGSRPLRIFASGVFGMNPTDPIISREDALLIISNAENRVLLREGRVVFIIDDAMLKSSL